MRVLAVASAVCATGAAAWAVRGKSSSVFGPSVWRGSSGRRAVALTFDDGPSESTGGLLRLLEGHSARATFFQCGVNAERLKQAAREVSAAGHEIGNHTYSHPRLWLRTPAFVEDEVDRAQRTLEDVHGASPRYLRAPYGVRWFGLRRAQRRHGLLSVMWTAIGRDWKLDAAAVAARLLRSVTPGAILCLHDGRGTSVRPDIANTLEAVARLLPALARRGYRFETLSEILRPAS
jgi:peptidoglycan/xylan/chitin deacetylase (PgdA/CDA1 family)